jgi:ribonuclease P protein component
MASGIECKPELDVPSSRPDAKRVASASLPRPLSRSKDFRAVLARGTRRRTGDLVVVAGPGIPDEVRVGFAVGKRVGNAVLRNRAKRRLRHAAGGVEWPSGTDVVIIADASAVTVEFGTLVGWLRAAAASTPGADRD